MPAGYVAKLEHSSLLLSSLISFLENNTGSVEMVLDETDDSLPGQNTRGDDAQTLESEKRKLELESLLLDLQLQRLDLQEKRVALELRKVKLTADDRAKNKQERSNAAMQVLKINRTMSTEAYSISPEYVEYEVDSIVSYSSEDSKEEQKDAMWRRDKNTSFISNDNQLSLSRYLKAKGRSRKGEEETDGLMTSAQNSSEAATWTKLDESASLTSGSLGIQAAKVRKTKRIHKKKEPQADELKPCNLPASAIQLTEKNNSSPGKVLQKPSTLDDNHSDHSAPTERITGSSQRKTRRHSLSDMSKGLFGLSHSEPASTAKYFTSSNNYFKLRSKEEKKKPKMKRRTSLDMALKPQYRSHPPLSNAMDSLCYSTESDPQATPKSRNTSSIKYDLSAIVGAISDEKEKKKKKKKKRKKKSRMERRHTLV